MKKAHSARTRLVCHVGALAALGLLLNGCDGGGVVGANYNANEKLLFPTIPDTMMAINGLATEPVWANSFKFYLEDGASSAGAFMRGMADSKFLYLYFEVEDPEDYDFDDVVVLAFNPTNASNNYKRVMLFPCRDHDCQASAGGELPAAQFSTGHEEPAGEVKWDPIASGFPPGVEAKANAAPDGMGDGGRWSIELKIDKTVYPFLANNFFGMFADVISTTPATNTAVQYTWPAGGHIGTNTFTQLEVAPLSLKRWGNVTLDTNLFPGGGLKIMGFGTNQADPTSIATNRDNLFFASVANGPGVAGAAPDVTGISATFKISNYGLPGGWGNIPATDNPTIPPETLKIREYASLHPKPWKPKNTGIYAGSGMSEFDYFNTHRNQCVRVEVGYTGAGSPLMRQYNMHFVEVMSPFDQAPEIATGLWRKQFPEAKELILTEQFLNAGPRFGWQSKFEGAEPAGDHRWVIKSMTAEHQQLRTSTLPDASLKLPVQTFALDPVAMSSGKTVDMPVRGGTIMTLLADGETTVRKQPVTAAGMSAQEAERLGFKPEVIADSLIPGRNARVGALVGSFDDFHTSFQIGTGATIFVPVSAQRLRLRFARDVPFDGGTFRLDVVATEPNAVSLDGNPLDALRGSKGPVLLPLGINLPLHIVRGVLDTGTGLVIGKTRYRAAVPVGSYGAMVRRVRGSGSPTEPGGPQLGPIERLPGTRITATPVPVRPR